MNNFIKLTFFILSILFLTSCGESKSESKIRGQTDGYAAGYNYLCAGGGTKIAADWDNKYYSDGYAEGYESGAGDCFDEIMGDMQDQISSMEVEIEILKQTIIELQN